ncbi:hypothetical protein EJB05_13901, partial [Eragrostis curvula]
MDQSNSKQAAKRSKHVLLAREPNRIAAALRAHKGNLCSLVVLEPDADATSVAAWRPLAATRLSGGMLIFNTAADVDETARPVGWPISPSTPVSLLQLELCIVHGLQKLSITAPALEGLQLHRCFGARGFPRLWALPHKSVRVELRGDGLKLVLTLPFFLCASSQEQLLDVEGEDVPEPTDEDLMDKVCNMITMMDDQAVLERSPNSENTQSFVQSWTSSWPSLYYDISVPTSPNSVEE